MGDQAGYCRQVVVVQRRSLTQVWLYLNNSVTLTLNTSSSKIEISNVKTCLTIRFISRTLLLLNLISLNWRLCLMELNFLGSLLGLHGQNIESNFTNKTKQKISHGSQTEWSLDGKQISNKKNHPIWIANTDHHFCFCLFSYCYLLL